MFSVEKADQVGYNSCVCVYICTHTHKNGQHNFIEQVYAILWNFRNTPMHSFVHFYLHCTSFALHIKVGFLATYIGCLNTNQQRITQCRCAQHLQQSDKMSLLLILWMSLKEDENFRWCHRCLDGHTCISMVAWDYSLAYCSTWFFCLTQLSCLLLFSFVSHLAILECAA